MKRAHILFFVFVLSIAIGHAATLISTPSVIMQMAIESLAARGVQANNFVMTPRVTPQTQTVVRPSPDLAYSVCLFDFSKNSSPLAIAASAWTSYGSISFFDSETNNFATVRVVADEDASQLTRVRLFPPDSKKREASAIEHHVKAPTQKGVILIRRLAPSAQDYEKVVAVAKFDRCVQLR